MERETFRKLVEKYLVPLFSGASLKDDFAKSSKFQSPTSWRDPCSFNIKPRKEDTYCVVLARSQPFAKGSTGFVTEFKVVQAFVKNLISIEEGIDTAFESDLLRSLTRRIAATSICHDSSEENAVLEVIDKLDEWSTKLYEGQPIAAAIGLGNFTQTTPIKLASLWKHEFSSVITNGFDTMLVSNYARDIRGYESLGSPSELPLFVPHRLAPIANWTTAKKGRLGIVLNRMGEILLLRDGQLVFARRGGAWHFLTHEPVITQMQCPNDKDVRRAVYASCLDASFARTGACVGVLTSGDRSMLSKVAPESKDHFDHPTRWWN